MIEDLKDLSSFSVSFSGVDVGVFPCCSSLLVSNAKVDTGVFCTAVADE